MKNIDLKGRTFEELFAPITPKPHPRIAQLEWSIERTGKSDHGVLTLTLDGFVIRLNLVWHDIAYLAALDGIDLWYWLEHVQEVFVRQLIYVPEKKP